MAYKRITPKMEKQMTYLLNKGCSEEQYYLDPSIAMLYSLIPGGGQFYVGERKKGILYLLSAPLIFPYLTSFKDAQNSVDYYNEGEEESEDKFANFNIDDYEFMEDDDDCLYEGDYEDDLNEETNDEEGDKFNA